MTAIGKVFLALAGALLGLVVYVHFTIAFWGDQDWELLSAGMLLDGKKLYTDNFTLLPPLIFYLYMLPVALSRHVTFVQDYQALVLFGLAGIALSTMLCARMIAVHSGFANDPGRRLQFIVLLCFLFVFRIASPYFADREHIFMVLTFPYMLRWMPSLARVSFSGRMRTVTGLLAGIGFCVKPHCMLLFAGIQLLALLRRDPPRILWSLENRIIYLVGIVYLLFVAAFTPDYFSVVLPMSLLTYSAISAGPGTLFDFTILITLAMTFIMFRWRAASPYRRDIWYFCGVALVLFGYGLANNGWGYTYQPVITLLLLLNAFVLWEFIYLKKEREKLAQPIIICMLGIVLCLFNFASKAAVVLMYFYNVHVQSCHGDSKCHGYYTTFVQEAIVPSEPHTFGMIGMNYALWARVAKLSGAEWVTRFPQFWMIPKFIISDADFSNTHRWILFYVANALADDLEQKKPEVVFVDVSQTIYTIRLHQPLDWIASFSVFENFQDAWKHYTYVHTIDSCATTDPAQAVGYAMMRRAPVSKADCRYDVYHRIH